jgi:hypothetical protein
VFVVLCCVLSCLIVVNSPTSISSIIIRIIISSIILSSSSISISIIISIPMISISSIIPSIIDMVPSTTISSRSIIPVKYQCSGRLNCNVLQVVYKMAANSLELQ